MSHTRDDTPESVRNNELQGSYFGILREGLVKHGFAAERAKDVAATAAQAVDGIVYQLSIVN